MEAIKLTTQIGTDGVLNLKLPADTAGAACEVIILYQPRPERENWNDFIDRTFGSLADDPLDENPPDLPPPVRDEVEC